jgi:O-antigen ligase
MDKPHNEYLKMFYEGGIIGVCLFLFALLGTLINLIYVVRRSRPENWMASAAYMAWIGFILMAIVDNPLVYGNNFLHPLFMMVGAANAIQRRESSMHPGQPSEESGQGMVTNQAIAAGLESVGGSQRLRPKKIMLR